MILRYLKSCWNGQFDTPFFILLGNLVISFMFVAMWWLWWDLDGIVNLTPNGLLGLIVLLYLLARTVLSSFAEWGALSGKVFHTPLKMLLRTIWHIVFDKNVRNKIAQFLHVADGMGVTCRGIAYYKDDTYMFVWKEKDKPGAFGTLLNGEGRPITPETMMPSEHRTLAEAICYIGSRSMDELAEEQLVYGLGDDDV